MSVVYIVKKAKVTCCTWFCDRTPNTRMDIPPTIRLSVCSGAYFMTICLWKTRKNFSVCWLWLIIIIYS